MCKESTTVKYADGSEGPCEHFPDVDGKVIRTIKAKQIIERERKCGYCKGKYWTIERTRDDWEKEKAAWENEIEQMHAGMRDYREILERVGEGIANYEKVLKEMRELYEQM